MTRRQVILSFLIIIWERTSGARSEVREHVIDQESRRRRVGSAAGSDVRQGTAAVAHTGQVRRAEIAGRTAGTGGIKGQESTQKVGATAQSGGGLAAVGTSAGGLASGSGSEGRCLLIAKGTLRRWFECTEL